MQWLLLFLVGLAERLATWYVSKGVKIATIFVTYVTLTIGLFTAMISAMFLSINAIIAVAPPNAGHLLTLLPPNSSVAVSIYLTAIILRRVYDFQRKFTRDFMQATLNF